MERLPSRPRASEARRMNRSSWCGRSGASVAATMMMEPSRPAAGPASAASSASSASSFGRSGRRSGISRPTGTPAMRICGRRPKLDCTSTPTVYSSPAAATIREEVPMPALKPKVRIPVPPPTEPSATGPEAAESSAAKTCSRCTWKPLMSFRNPSQVSATSGRLQSGAARFCCAQAMVASCTAPTLWVFVIMTAPSRIPRSRSQVVPVISPLPFRVNQAANTRPRLVRPRGRTAVTPVRTGPSPTRSGPWPRMMVWWPTSTPGTSVIALPGPGVPSKGTPRSRARGAPASWARTAPGRSSAASSGSAAAAAKGRFVIGVLIGVFIGVLMGRRGSLRQAYGKARTGPGPRRGRGARPQEPAANRDGGAPGAAGGRKRSRRIRGGGRSRPKRRAATRNRRASRSAYAPRPRIRSPQAER